MYTSSREVEEEEEEEVDARMRPCERAIESRTHLVGEDEMYKKGLDVLKEEVREIEECDMEEIGTLLIDSSEKTIAILGDRWWPHVANQDGGGYLAKQFCVL